MKFKKLTIRNIASIKDAVVDFTATPVCDARLFLINGPTGAGKSTILDAICLALYNNIPRLSEYGNRTVSHDLEGDVRLGSPLGIVRKGVTEAFVELEFEGNDAGTYRARWEGVFSRKNTKNRARGTLIGYEHTLTTANGDIISLKTGARDNILSSPGYVGMNFDRFKRTTLLAQGEFSKFLSATPDEKCTILENLSGVKRFGNYGRLIHAGYVRAENALDRLTDSLGGIKLLSAGELALKEEELRNLRTESKAKETAIEAMNTVKAWFDTEKTLSEAVGRRQDEAQKALAVVESDDFRASENLVARWRRLRPLVDVNTQTADAVARREAVENELNNLGDELRMIVRSLRAVTSRLDEARRRRIACQNAVSAFDGRRGLIDSARVIISRIDDILLLHADVAKLTKDVQRLEKAGAAAAETLASRLADRCEAEKTLVERQRVLDNVAGRLKKHVNSPRGAQLRADTEEQKRITLFLDSTRDYINRVSAFNTEAAKNESDKTELAGLRDAVQKLHDDYGAKLAEYEVARAAYEAVLTTTDALVKALRHGLKPGCKCPVCNRTVESVVRDDIFDSQLGPARQRRDEAEKAMNTALTTYNNAAAEAKLLDKKIVKASDAAKKESNALKILEEKILSDGAKLGLKAATGLDAVRLAEVRNRELGKAIESMSDFLAVARQITNENTEAADAVAAARRAHDAASAKYDKEKTEADRIRTDIETQKKEIKSKNDTIAQYRAEISDVASIDGTTNLENLKSKVTEIAEAYHNAVKDSEAIEKTVATLENTVTNIREALGDVDNIEVGEGPTYPENEIFGHVSAYKTRLGVCNANKTAVCAELDTLSKTRAGLLETLVDMSPEDIGNPTLGKTVSDVENLADGNEKARKEARDAATSLKAVQDQMADHAANRPPSELDSESAVAGLAQLTAAKTDVDRRMGAVETELETDSANRQRHAGVLAEIEKARTTFDTWAELDKYFGNDRFKRIVCSYILAELVERANYYLAKFRPRYSMHVNPGNLEILVRDGDMGVTRVFNTLSGGETFMTSLSLALGLASMNDAGFAADTIFIDEGFGTLSSDCLETVMDSLDRLNSFAGRRVGIISHVESLRDRIPTRIELTPHGTYSTVEVLGS